MLIQTAHLKKIKTPTEAEELAYTSTRAHALFRAYHQAPALIYSKDIEIVAQAYANKLAQRDVAEHSGNPNYGENIAWSSGTKLSGDQVTKLWYDEVRDYSFSNPGFGSKTGHFTQVVWKGTQQFGIGKAQSSRGGWYYVANYYSPGNYEGEFRNNVLPKIDILKSDDFTSKAFNKINELRRRHQSTPDVTLDPSLNDVAKDIADKFAKGEFVDTINSPYGINYGIQVSTNVVISISGGVVIDNWYKEGKDYFEQIVWKSSLVVGVGISISPTGQYGYAVVFFPKRNYLTRADNVMPLNTVNTSTITQITAGQKFSLFK